MRTVRALCFGAVMAAAASVGCKDGGGGAGGTAGTGGDPALPFVGEVTTLVDALSNADFVFEGEVTAIEYANSMNNGTGGPDPDDADDLGVLPHTFVTYRIMEDFSGNASEETVTMRFMGGVDVTSGPDWDLFEVSETPQFDIGDRDIVLMKGNTEFACPIVSCAHGRFRVLRGPNDDSEFIYTEYGQELRLLEDSASQARLFAIGDHQIEPIVSQVITMPDGETHELRIASIDEGGEQEPGVLMTTAKHSREARPDDTSPTEDPEEPFDAPVAGARVQADGFRALVRKAIADHPDFAWLPYANADPAAPFTVGSFADSVGPANDDDPIVEPPMEDEFERLEGAAAAALGMDDDGTIDPAVALDIALMRQTATGILEMPNEEDEQSRAEDMWVDP